MTEKRFKVTDNTNNPYLSDWNVTDYADGGIVSHPMTSENMANVICDLLNELHEEKEDWKNNCLKSVNENSILWNEISILREQGAEPSDAFKNYLNNLKNKNNKLQGDLE